MTTRSAVPPCGLALLDLRHSVPNRPLAHAPQVAGVQVRVAPQAHHRAVPGQARDLQRGVTGLRSQLAAVCRNVWTQTSPSSRPALVARDFPGLAVVVRLVGVLAPEHEVIGFLRAWQPLQQLARWPAR